MRSMIAALLRDQNLQLAQFYALRAIELVPDDAVSHYNLGCVEARLGHADAAIASLKKAVDLDFRGAEIMQNDSDLVSLHDHADWPAILEQAQQAPPDPKKVKVDLGIIRDGVGEVTEKNTIFDPATGMLRTFLRHADARAAQELSASPITRHGGPIGQKFDSWQKAGEAAGLVAVMYDNHDKDHSNMNYGQFPQLTRIEYSEAAARESLNNGLQHVFRFNGIVVGNSSTSHVSGPFWRSNPRMAYTDSRLASRIAVQYLSNHIYVYPEHRDYDPGHNGGKSTQQSGAPAVSSPKDGYGDVYPANTPYLLISQGSSGSDRVFLDALTHTIAALRPQVQSQLAANGLLMPVVQMIFRRCYGPVTSDADYLSGKAHPVVFQGDQIDTERLIDLAHAITPETLPPIALLKVVAEDEPTPGIDYFEFQAREHLFTTPAAIARIGRSVQRDRKITLSAADSKDLNGHDLTFHWVVTQGDPDRIQINSVNTSQSTVELIISHHPRFPIASNPEMESNRVDIAAFAHNGHHYSAPAFVSFYFPDNEDRSYDNEGRIQSVVYGDPADGGNYIDTAIVTPIKWRDDYRYDSTGNLLGWIRSRGQASEEFTRDGALVTEHDSAGRPLKAQTVTYLAKPRPKLPTILEQFPGTEVLVYEYESAEDTLGKIVKRIPVDER